MKNMSGFVTVVFIFIFIFGAVITENVYSDQQSGFTKHYKDSLFKVTKEGLYSVEMVIKKHELVVGNNEVDIIIHDRNDKDVVGATIQIVPWMPDMGHGVSTKPVITEKGGGLYNAQDVELSMSGLWELRITVMKDAVEDSAVFEFPDVKSGHAHHKIDAPKKSDIDLSTTRMSDDKLFHVTYKSTIMPIPVNKIHSWELDVKTADGLPFKGAEIEIKGDMPEHGHGMPTEPEVTEELGDGKYLIEGMKFSMPGWWVIKFEIEKGEREDKVTFNLFLN